MIPQSYLDRADLLTDLSGNWNLQPMHVECNNRKKGQVNGRILFICSCHGTYVNDNYEWKVMYKTTYNNGNHEWREIAYQGGSATADTRFLEATTKDRKGEVLAEIIVYPTRLGPNEWGWMIGKAGHSFEKPKIYKRIGVNIQELERTEQWERVCSESEMFAEHYNMNHGIEFEEEFNQNSFSENVHIIARIIERSRRAQKKARSTECKLLHVENMAANTQRRNDEKSKAIQAATTYFTLLNAAKEHRAAHNWEQVQETCDQIFKIREREGPATFRDRMGKLTIDVLAAFYYEALIARLCLKHGEDEALVEMAESLKNTGGQYIENEIGQEIYESDLDDFVAITDKVKNNINKLVVKAIENKALTVHHWPCAQPQPKFRWRLARPSQGKRVF